MSLRFPELGQSEADVRAELAAATAADFDYEGGQIVGTMISGSHSFAKGVFAEHLDVNVADRGHFPGLVRIEGESVAMLGDLLNCSNAVGHIVSGGNEANILALWTARDRSGRTEIVIPDTAHVSYDKAARLLQLGIVRLAVDDRGRVDPVDVERAVGDRTAAIVAVAGTTDLGTVDRIDEIARIAIARDVHLHVDAAFGGFVLPFLRELGHEIPPFDFSVDGVRSMTIDPHKMGLVPQPAGSVLFRDAADLDRVRVDIPYLSGGPTTQATLTGTRSGAPVAAVWAMIRHFGRAGYRRVVADCMERTARLARAVESMSHLRLAAAPVTNLIGIAPRQGSVRGLAEALRGRGWAIAEFPRHLRVVLLPHVTDAVVDRFIDALQQLKPN